MKPAASTTSTDAIRKVGILIASLDTVTANRLLDKMPAEQADRVRRAMHQLPEIRPDEQEQVIREFMQAEPQPGDAADDGVELDDGLAAKLRSPNGYDPLPGSTEPSTRPFQTLWEANPLEVARQLERQHPQAIALVLAHFPPRRAAAVLECLTSKMQADVLRRVAELSPADPDVVREVEIELEQLLSGELNAARNRNSGLLTVAAIVKAAGGGRQSLLGNLECHHRDLASQLQDVVPQPTEAPHRDSRPNRVGSGQMTPAAVDQETRPTDRSGQETHDPTPPPTSLAIEFEELANLADADWATLIRSLDPQLVLLALAGASEQLIDRIAGQLPATESRSFRRRLEQLGPVQLADIDRAQYHVASRASQLAAQEMIHLPSRKAFAAAA